MASNKAKRPVLLAQPKRRSPNPEPAEFMPVKAHVYRAIAELNGSLEKVVHDLHILARIPFLNPDGVTAMHHQICRIRARANREFTMALHDREVANSGHFDQLASNGKKHNQTPA